MLNSFKALCRDFHDSIITKLITYCSKTINTEVICLFQCVLMSSRLFPEVDTGWVLKRRRSSNHHHHSTMPQNRPQFFLIILFFKSYYSLPACNNDVVNFLFPPVYPRNRARSLSWQVGVLINGDALILHFLSCDSAAAIFMWRHTCVIHTHTRATATPRMAVETIVSEYSFSLHRYN